MAIVTSELANHRAQKALFTCVVHTKYAYLNEVTAIVLTVSMASGVQFPNVKLAMPL